MVGLHSQNLDVPMVEMERKPPSLTALILAVWMLATVILVLRSDTTSLVASGRPFPADRLAGFPKIILWAWERPEELGFIDPREVGVAFLAVTLYLRGERVIVRPRLQPLNVPHGTALLAVVRIEADRSEPPALSSDQRARLVSAMTDLTRMPGITGIQVDFDAKASERPFYRDLLFDLRRELPDSLALSITALASWCIHDNWLVGLPIDEAVPMLFRMGPDRHRILLHLETGADFRPPICQQSIGISTDEPIPLRSLGRRIYIFHPRPWSPGPVRSSITKVRESL